jgi:hypothetical protein
MTIITTQELKQIPKISLNIKHYCGHTTIVENEEEKAKKLFKRKHCAFCKDLLEKNLMDLIVLMKE